MRVYLGKTTVKVLGWRGRYVFFLAIVAGLLVIPVAQAGAAEPPKAVVNIEGSGSGEVVSALHAVGEAGPGTPRIECAYSGSAESGVCENEPEPVEAGEGLYSILLEATPAPGSEFVGWTVQKGDPSSCPYSPQPSKCFASSAGEFEEGVVIEVTAKFKATAPAGPIAKVNIEGSGSGEVVSALHAVGEAGPGTPRIECAYSGSAESGVCENEPEPVEAGEGLYSILLEATPAPGSEFVGWTVQKGDPSSCPYSPQPSKCFASSAGEFEEGVVIEVTAKFKATAPAEFPLTVTKSGAGFGTVTSSPPGINCGTTCSAEFEEAEVVTLSPSESIGSEFVEWTGACTGNGACAVTMTGAKAVTAIFNTTHTNPSTLTVFKGGNGAGTITSTPAGINCVAEPCEATFVEGETIELTAVATANSVFAGWLGCHPVVGEPTKCHVTLSRSEVDVTAVFLVEGKVGPEGPTGPSGPAGPTGLEGPAGNPGFPGETGAQGPTGAQGAQGPAGSQGVTGAQGAQGVQGPVGKVKVTCTVRGTRSVVCKVQYPKAQSSNSSSRHLGAKNLHWTLRRSGAVVLRDQAQGAQVEIPMASLERGRYHLQIDGENGTAVVVVP